MFSIQLKGNEYEEMLLLLTAAQVVLLSFNRRTHFTTLRWANAFWYLKTKTGKSPDCPV